MVSRTEMLLSTHVMSFEKRMNDGFYSRVDQSLVMPKEQRFFHVR